MKMKLFAAATFVLVAAAPAAYAFDYEDDTGTVVDENETTGSVVIEKQRPVVIIKKRPTIIIEKQQPDVVIHQDDTYDDGE